MNHNRKVVVFTISTTLVLFFYSIYAAFYPTDLKKFENINIVSDVFKVNNIADSLKEQQTQPGNVESLPAEVEKNSTISPRSLQMYRLSKTITAFFTDTNRQALPALMNKLYAIRKGKRDKVRIAWMGDSLIEGDLLTQTFRKKLQPVFGGFGVGFIPVTSVVAPFRTTVSHKWTGDWKEENFKTKELSGSLFLSGHVFRSASGTFTVKDQSFKDSLQRLEKSLICGYYPGQVTISVNGTRREFQPRKKINRLLLDSTTSHAIEIGIQNDRLPVYGLSFEPQSGVVVDNFSFRGITGLELAKLDTAFLHDLQLENHYDLVILEYGANLLFRPNDSDYSWFQSHIKPVVKRLKEAMPNTEFLIISSSDRAFKYGENWQSAKGINNLIKSQAELAYENNAAFYNLYASMGGSGTIAKWVETTPSLANKDYIHPNLRGAEILGSIFFESFIKDFEKSTSHYIVSPEHTIIDTKNKLEWLVAGPASYTWDNAVKWIKELNKKKGNWTLPTSEQILTLYNVNTQAGEGFVYQNKTFYAHIDPAFSSIGKGAWVWCSEDKNINTAYCINLHLGLKIETLKKCESHPIHAFAVRKYVGNSN